MSEIDRLNSESDQSTVYKLLYIGRHGQGVHNVAENYYGTAEWDVSAYLASLACQNIVAKVAVLLM